MSVPQFIASAAPFALGAAIVLLARVIQPLVAQRIIRTIGEGNRLVGEPPAHLSDPYIEAYLLYATDTGSVTGSAVAFIIGLSASLVVFPLPPIFWLGLVIVACLAVAPLVLLLRADPVRYAAHQRGKRFSIVDVGGIGLNISAFAFLLLALLLL